MEHQEPSEREIFDDGRNHAMIEAVTRLALQKWTIARLTGTGMLLGLILCFALPVRYTAVTKIMPPKQTPSTTSFLNAQMGVGALADAAGGALLKDPNAMYIGLLKSRPIAEVIIAKYDLATVYHERNLTAARKQLANSTRIVSEPSTLISISVTDRNKQRAADIANCYAAQLSVLTKAISFTEASRRRLFFEDQLRTQKEALVGAEVALQDVQQDRGLVRLDAQANVLIERIAAMRVQIASKEVELQALRSYSTEHNPEVQLAERELSSMQSEAAQLGQHNEQVGSSDMGLKDVPKAGLDYVRASRELQYQQSLFDLLLRQYEAARLDEAKEAAVIQVVEPAIQPDQKSSPKPMMILPVATFFGFFIGSLCALFRNWMEREKANPDGAAALERLKLALSINDPRIAILLANWRSSNA